MTFEETNDDEVLIEDNEGIETFEEEKEPEKEPEKDEEEDYSRKVQKRINKLVAERNAERQKREEIELRLADQEKRFHEFEERFSKREQESHEANIDEQIRSLRRRKIQLYDEGNFEEAADIDDQIIDLKLKKREEPKSPPKERQESPPQTRQVPQAQQEWLESNDWYFNPAKQRQAKKANDIYLSLVNDGYDPDDPDTYAELDSRLSSGQEKQKEPEKEPEKEPQQTVSAPDRGSVTGPVRGKKTFTNADLQKMRYWNIPDTPENRAEWLKNKRA